MTKIGFQNLNLSKIDRDSISAIMKYSKSSAEGAKTDIIYEKDALKKLKNIRECYLLFFNVCNNIEIISDDIKGKLQSYINQFKDINIKVVYFLNYNFSIKFGSSIIFKKIDIFLSENDEMINNLLYETFLLGKEVKKYNPGETTGYY